MGKSDPLTALSSQCNMDGVSTTAVSDIKASDTQDAQEAPTMEINDLMEPDPLSDSNDDVIVEDASKVNN